MIDGANERPETNPAEPVGDRLVETVPVVGVPGLPEEAYPAGETVEAGDAYRQPDTLEPGIPGGQPVEGTLDVGRVASHSEMGGDAPGIDDTVVPHDTDHGIQPWELFGEDGIDKVGDGSLVINTGRPLLNLDPFNLAAAEVPAEGLATGHSDEHLDGEDTWPATGGAAEDGGNDWTFNTEVNPEIPRPVSEKPWRSVTEDDESLAISGTESGPRDLDTSTRERSSIYPDTDIDPVELGILPPLPEGPNKYRFDEERHRQLAELNQDLDTFWLNGGDLFFMSRIVSTHADKLANDGEFGLALEVLDTGLQWEYSQIHGADYRDLAFMAAKGGNPDLALAIVMDNERCLAGQETTHFTDIPDTDDSAHRTASFANNWLSHSTRIYEEVVNSGNQPSKKLLELIREKIDLYSHVLASQSPNGVLPSHPHAPETPYLATTLGPTVQRLHDVGETDRADFLANLIPKKPE